MPVPDGLIETLVDMEAPSDAQFAPDGSVVAYVLGRANRANKDATFEKKIHLVDAATKQDRVLTPETGTNEQPRWSPDGKRIAFVSNRANHEEMQLFVADAESGAADALTDLRGVVDAPQWSPDGRAIAFLYSGTLDAEKPPEADPLVMDAEPPFRRVWVVDVETRELRRVTPLEMCIFEYAWSPDGGTLAALASAHPNPTQAWYSAQLHTVDVGSGEMRQTCTMQHQIGRLTWSPDGGQIGFVSGVLSDQGNVSGEVYVVAAAGGEARCVTPGIDHSITWIEWRDEGILYGGRQVEGAILGWIDPASGARRTITNGMYAINGHGPQYVSVGGDGSFAAVRESFTEPPNVWLGALANGAWERLTDYAPELPPLRVENKYWRGADGREVHGYLVCPADYTPGKPYPLFAHVHGGPSWSYVPRFGSLWERVLTAMGCLVLMPNPRGSWGRGHGFQSANVGDLGGGDWQDISAGVDAMVAEGLADPAQLAVGGWSYGGYLTTWAVTQTDRFKCAVAGASITNYESNYGNVPNREWQTTMFGANFYDDAEHQRSRSPITHVRRVKTPTLLVHGLLDRDAPAGQAEEFYTALRYYGVPAQLVYYPREPHGFQERAHQIDLYERIVGWVDKYLFGKG